jgi:unsaturated rhamnogalacturonyl hydrolase
VRRFLKFVRTTSALLRALGRRAVTRSCRLAFVGLELAPRRPIPLGIDLRHGRKVRPLLLLLAFIACAASPVRGMDPADIRAHMRRVFEWQVQHPWSEQHPLDHRWGNRGWVQGAFLTGVMEAYRATGDETYLDYARRRATENHWLLGGRWRHADDHIGGQTYVELHLLAPAASPLEVTREVVDRFVQLTEPGREVWSWCDALYMSPPLLTKLARVTGDPTYLGVLDRWYWDIHDALYDEEERLFYRDSRFLAPADGRKIFWSRGNGWVLAGLARLLDDLPPEHATRTRYEALFRVMAERVVQLQPNDGLWRADLLRPMEAHGESSGSAFFAYALAWGIRQELLPEAAYRPAVEHAWHALVGCVDEDGKLGWVQPIGYAPDAYDATTAQEYGAGAFLAAGAHLLPLASSP